MQQIAVRPGHFAMRDSGMELSEFGLELFVDQEKCLQRAANVAVATGDDFVDRGFV